MSFLDNLENSLKNMESREERGPEDHRRRDAERAKAQAIAPWADKLKQSDYVKALMGEATRAGHKMRGKVYIAWIGTTLRLEFRERKLELRPTPDGVQAAFIENNADVKIRPVDLNGSPAELVQEWLKDAAPSERNAQ